MSGKPFHSAGPSSARTITTAAASQASRRATAVGKVPAGATPGSAMLWLDMMGRRASLWDRAVTRPEYRTLMEAMTQDLAGRQVESFYYLARATLVKDERNLDKFDRVFGHVFRGLALVEEALTAEIPAEWLKGLAEKYLTDEEKKLIEAMGGLDK